MLCFVQHHGSMRLNDSGERGIARVVSGGAVHWSRSQETRPHAHYAWKLHLGLDAPVWLAGDVQLRARALVVPPHCRHATGGVGWSLAVFLAPGSRRYPLVGDRVPQALSSRSAERLLAACRSVSLEHGEHTPELVDELARLLREAGLVGGAPARGDARAVAALDRLRLDPDLSLRALAAQEGLTLDRLTRIVSRQTGMPLRRHVLWSRLLRVLSSGRRPASLAAAALEAGFSDHAHMTRTYREFLGRAPSEFTHPPEVIAPW